MSFYYNVYAHFNIYVYLYDYHAKTVWKKKKNSEKLGADLKTTIFSTSLDSHTNRLPRDRFCGRWGPRHLFEKIWRKVCAWQYRQGCHQVSRDYRSSKGPYDGQEQYFYLFLISRLRPVFDLFICFF